MRIRSLGSLAALLLLLCAVVAAAGGEADMSPVGYTPEPALEELIQQTQHTDKFVAESAIDKLAKIGKAAEDALQVHLFKEATPNGQMKWAELLARCGRGQLAYRVTLELDPEGAGTVTLWSDRSVLAECGKRYAHLLGRPESPYTDEALRHNPYEKLELLQYLNDRIKYEEGTVATHAGHVVATGLLSFKSFNGLENFAKSFDPTGYHMLGGCALKDSDSKDEQLRTFRFQKQREEDPRSRQENLLRFFDVRWEFVLDFKGHPGGTNTSRTDGTKEIWQFNCLQMLNGEVLIELSYDNAGLKKLSALPSVQAGIQPFQLVAIPKQTELRAKVFPKNAGVTPTAQVLRAHNQLVELDGRGSMPRDKPLQYQWTQVYGNSLKLSPEALAKDHVCLIVKEPGEYGFELVVSLDKVHSQPAEVKVIVTEDSPNTEKESATPAPPEVAEQTPAPTLAPAAPPVAAKQTPAPTPAPAAPPEAAKQTSSPTPAPAAPPEAAKQTPAPTPTPAAPPEAAKQTPAPTPAPAAPPVSGESKKVQAPVVPPAEEAVKPDAAKAGEFHAQGLKLWKANKLSEAKTALAQACALNPEDLGCQSDLALVLMDLNELPEAIKIFKEVAEGANGAEACMNVGHCYVRMGRLNEARGWYLRGVQSGGAAVDWERAWQLGNSQLWQKDYPAALIYLETAEKKASEAHAVDFRLLRDLATALHGCKKDDEALNCLKKLQELGYSPDAALLAKVTQGASASAKTGENKPETDVVPQASKAVKTEPLNAAPKTDEAPVAIAAGTAKPVALNAAQKTDEAPEREKQSPPPVKIEPQTKAVVVQLPNPPPEPPSKLSSPDEGRVAEKKTEHPPIVINEPQKRKEAPPHKPPLPPVPNNFDEALLAGKRAFQAGVRFHAQDTEEAKLAAARCFDEAEAMLRGAWVWQPGDENLLAAFRELSQYVGVIALTRNPVVVAKTKGLVVLDATASIVPKDKPVYCVWEQVDGERLDLRPENMTKLKVGIRIAKAGTYKFEFAISDGARGGNPITVTVEVTE